MTSLEAPRIAAGRQTAAIEFRAALAYTEGF